MRTAPSLPNQKPPASLNMRKAMGLLAFEISSGERVQVDELDSTAVVSIKAQLRAMQKRNPEAFNTLVQEGMDQLEESNALKENISKAKQQILTALEQRPPNRMTINEVQQRLDNGENLGGLNAKVMELVDEIADVIDWIYSSKDLNEGLYKEIARLEQKGFAIGCKELAEISRALINECIDRDTALQDIRMLDEPTMEIPMEEEEEEERVNAPALEEFLTADLMALPGRLQKSFRQLARNIGINL